MPLQHLFSWQRSLRAVAVMIPVLTLAGCVSAQQRTRYNELNDQFAEIPVVDTKVAEQQSVVLSDDGAISADASTKSDAGEKTNAQVLDRDRLIAEVMKRNPTIESARIAWQKSLTKYPQTITFNDPTVTYQFGPATIFAGNRFGQTITVAQRFEWPGKQSLRGDAALAESDVFSENYKAVKLRLRTAASMLFDDYFAVQRALDINDEHLQIVKRLRQSAEAHYDSGHGSQQDPLQVDVERSLLEKERVGLQAKKDAIAAQINGLLHRDPDATIPNPPSTLPVATIPTFSTEQWTEQAKTSQPELLATDKMIRAKDAAIKVAQKSYYPDFSVMASYSSMWPMLPHRFMVGVMINIPINLASRDAKVDEANAALLMAKNQYIQKLNDISVEVKKAVIAFNQAVEQVAIYKDKIIPSAKRRIEAAEAGYIAGKVPFSDMLIAQRQLETFQRDYFDMIANTWRSRAKLIQAVGELKDGEQTQPADVHTPVITDQKSHQENQQNQPVETSKGGEK